MAHAPYSDLSYARQSGTSATATAMARPGSSADGGPFTLSRAHHALTIRERTIQTVIGIDGVSALNRGEH